MRISDWSSDVCSSDLGGDDERHHSDKVVRPLGGSSWSRDHRVVVVGWDETIEPATPLIAQFPLQVQMGPAAHSYDDQVARDHRSEEHTSELQSLMRISYAVFCLKKKTKTNKNEQST